MTESGASLVMEGVVSETFFGSIDPPGMVVDAAATGMYSCAVPKKVCGANPSCTGGNRAPLGTLADLRLQIGEAVLNQGCFLPVNLPSPMPPNEAVPLMESPSTLPA